MSQENHDGFRGLDRRAHMGYTRGRINSGRRGGHRSDKSYTPVKENEWVIKQRRFYEDVSPEFGPPKVIGSYSVDSDRSIAMDKSQLKFIERRFLQEKMEKDVNFDLKAGIGEDKPYKGSPNDAFENLLQWVLSNSSYLMSEKKNRSCTEFVSSRSVLTDITKSLYAPINPWSFKVILYNGTIYMKGNQKESFNPGPLLTRSGNKLEQLITTDNSTEGTDSNSEFRCVLSSQLKNKALIYCAKVDCADPVLFREDFNNLNSFVSVKINKELSSDKIKDTFSKHKICQAWIENHLSGIPRVIFGFRSEDFIVNTLKLIDTEDLPDIVNGSWWAWKPNGCINFLSEFLNHVKDTAVQHPEVVLEFEKEKFGNVTWKVSAEQNMLPAWYTDNLLVKLQSFEVDSIKTV